VCLKLPRHPATEGGLGAVLQQPVVFLRGKARYDRLTLG